MRQDRHKNTDLIYTQTLFAENPALCSFLASLAFLFCLQKEIQYCAD